MTGISAAWASLSESSQPDASVAVRRMTSTSSSTNVANASSCDGWSLGLAAGAYLSSKPAALLNASLTACSFALRHPPSGPTATKPTVVIPSPPGSLLCRPRRPTGAAGETEGERPCSDDADRSRIRFLIANLLLRTLDVERDGCVTRAITAM